MKNRKSTTASYSEDDPVGFFNELVQQLPHRLKQFTGWQSLAMDDKVFIFLQELDETQGISTDKNIMISRRKHVSAFFKGNKWKIDKRVLRKKGVETISKWSDLRFVIESFDAKAVKVEKEDPPMRTISDNSCRVCLSSDESNLQNLSFIEDDDGESFLQKLNFVSCLEIKDSESPRKICKKCIDDLRIACEMKKRCIDTDQVLRSMKTQRTSKVHEEFVCEIKNEVHEEFICEIKNEVLELEGDEVIELEEDEILEVDGNEIDLPASDFNNLKFMDIYQIFKQKHDAAYIKYYSSFGEHGCNFCNKRFQLQSQKREHLTKEHADILVCSECGKTKNSVLSVEFCLKVHSNAKEGKLTLKNGYIAIENRGCNFCDNTFTSELFLKEHMRREHSDILVCSECGKKKKSVLSVLSCLKIHKNGYPHLCQHCGKGFTKRSMLVEHLRNVHGPESKTRYSCDLCTKKLKHKESLRRHLELIHLKFPVTTFACPHESCNEIRYTTKLALNIHLYRHHNVAAPETCQYCNLGFSIPSEVKAHLKKCRERPENRRRLEHMNSHYVVIDGKYQCRFCPRLFSNRKQVTMHKRRKHLDNRTCEICNKTFTTYTGFLTHVNLVHRKIKKYKCDFDGCGKAFGTKDILKSHRNTHTGEKPYACNICDYRSGDRTTLSKHLKKCILKANPQGKN